MKKISHLSFALAALMASPLAVAAVPAKIQLHCQSPDTGRIEVSLANPETNGNEIGYYAIQAKRFDPRTGALLGEVSHAVDTSSNDYRAEIWMNEGAGRLHDEPVLLVQLPAYGVNWARNAQSCYVKAPAPGFQFQIGLNTKKIVTRQYSEPSLNIYETNPEVSFVVIPGVGFGQVRDVLNGEYCPDVDGWKQIRGLSCELAVEK